MLSRHIGSVYLRNTYPENFYLWWNSGLQSGLVVSNESAIEFILDKKKGSAKGYKQNYFQKWLVIYAGGIGLHDLYTKANHDLIKCSEAKSGKSWPTKTTSNYFTHVWVWDKFTERIVLIYPYEKIVFDYGEGSVWVNHLPIE